MPRRQLSIAAFAGLIYFLVVFAAGFALGALRSTLIAPRLGAIAAVLLELPLILIVSWLACRWVIARLRVPETRAARGTMGGLAFALLMLAEALLGTVGFGRTLAEHVSAYQNPPEVLGLAGQLLFALIPIVMLKWKSF